MSYVEVKKSDLFVINMNALMGIYGIGLLGNLELCGNYNYVNETMFCPDCDSLSFGGKICEECHNKMINNGIWNNYYNK